MLIAVPLVGLPRAVYLLQYRYGSKQPNIIIYKCVYIEAVLNCNVSAILMNDHTSLPCEWDRWLFFDFGTAVCGAECIHIHTYELFCINEFTRMYRMV